MQILRGGTGLNYGVEYANQTNILVDVSSVARESVDWFAPGETMQDRNFRVLADGAGADALWTSLQGFATALGTANDPLPGLYDTGITYNIIDLNSNSIINSLLNAAGYDFISHTPWAEGLYGVVPQNPETFPGFMTLIDSGGANAYTAFANSMAYGDEYKFYKRDGNDMIAVEQQAAQLTVKNSSRLDDDGTTHIKIMWGTMDQFDIGLGLFGDFLVKDSTDRTVLRVDDYGTYAANNTIVEFSDYIYRRGDETANVLTAINNKSHVLEGWGGNDTLTGGTGNDILHGGAGNDSYIRSGGQDMIIENAANEGVDTLHFGAGVFRSQLLAYWDADMQMIYIQDTLLNWGMYVSGAMLAATATTEAITISFVEQGRDAGNIVFDIWGLVRPFGGMFVQTAATVDTGNVHIISEEDMFFYGTDASEVVYGSWLPDVIDAQGGDDVVYAGGWNDEVYGGMGNDELHGQDGDDTLYGDYGDDTLYGGAGDDTLTAARGSDTAYGGAGDDTLNTYWDGRAILVGGTGSDTYNIGRMNNSIVWLRENAADAGTDTVTFTMWSGAYERHYNTGTNDHNHLQIVVNQTTSDSPLSVRIILEGYFSGNNPFENIMRSGNNAGAIAFTHLNDIIRTYGSADNDQIQGVMGSGLGAGAWNDRIFAQGGHDLVFAGAGNDYVSGGTGNDILYGGEGVDALYGDIGNDTLIGEAGADTLTGGRGADLFIFGPSSVGAVDTITDFSMAENDKIDLTGLIAYDSLADDINHFVRLTENAGSSHLQVDRDGAGTAYGWEDIVYLQGATGLNIDTIIVTSVATVSD